MVYLRKSQDRGNANHGWLKSRHTFSFGDYYDKNHMGFGALRVINEDRIDGGTGFDTHSHEDMEIISYVIEGALRHKDSMGNTTLIKPREIQRMSAGTGVSHSEYNDLKAQETHFLQIWIMPEKEGIKPGYEQKYFGDEFGCSDMVLVASKLGKNGSITLNQDVDMYVAQAQAEGEKIYKTYSHRYLWIQVICGEVRIDEKEKLVLSPGDGAGVTGVEALKLSWGKGSEFIFFDLPA